MNATGTILVADDDRAIRMVLTQALGRLGYDVRTTGHAATLWRWVADGDGDLVITDVVMPDENGLDLVPRIRKLRPELRVIVMSAQNTLLTAVKATERGAFEYLPKPFDLKDLVAVVQRALTQSKGSAVSAVGEEEPQEKLPLIGRSPAMQEIYRVLARLMGTDLTVMIAGESGTGKELVARALHDYGKRRTGPFVAVNMAAIPRELIESELFGHEKGAFTGANQRHAGRFEQAQGGTLFLDEIGDMPIEAQTRLLRVLQEGEYTTIGGRQRLKADVRIVAATHRDLRQMVRQGLFREDLFYRLNVVPIRLPPLRERSEDIPELVKSFLGQCAAEGLPVKSLRPRPSIASSGIAGPATCANWRTSSGASPRSTARRRSASTSSSRSWPSRVRRRRRWQDRRRPHPATNRWRRPWNGTCGPISMPIRAVFPRPDCMIASCGRSRSR
jgi:two-component system nitrogen regulation response regulator GlnG